MCKYVCESSIIARGGGFDVYFSWLGPTGRGGVSPAIG